MGGVKHDHLMHRNAQEPAVDSMSASHPDLGSHLQRGLGLRSLVLFGLAYLAPIVVFSTFGILDQKSKGTVSGAYLAAMIAAMFTAYSYARRAFNAHLGFLVGWAVLLDYFFLPMVAWLIGTACLSTALPAVPSWIWVLIFICITTGTDLLGIRFADKVTFQILVIVAFTALCLQYVWIASGPGGLVSYAPFFRPGVPLGATLAGGAPAAFAFLGFDAISTMAEETLEPQRTIPRAIFLVAAIGGAIFIVASYFVRLANPGLTFADVDSASFELAAKVDNDLFVSIFLAALIVSQLAARPVLSGGYGSAALCDGTQRCLLPEILRQAQFPVSHATE